VQRTNPFRASKGAKTMARKKSLKVTPKQMAAMTLDELAALPGQYDLRMYDVKTSLWAPPEKRLVTGNPDTGLAWITKCEAAGYMTADDLFEQQNLIRACLKKLDGGGGAPDPASVANKKSGYGQKGSRKPTRDYRNGTAEGNGNPTGVTRMGRDHGPAKD
jgi:hypothetical protein